MRIISIKKKTKKKGILKAAIVIFLYIAIFASSGSVLANEQGLKLYIAKNGNDNWSGRLDAPSPSRDDGPFATLARARAEIRKMKAGNGLPNGGVVVELRGGVYYFEQPFVLNILDSGTPESPVIYRARRGEKVCLSGGVEISKWITVTDKGILDKLTVGAKGHVVQANLQSSGVIKYGEPSGGGAELFFADRPMTLARWPNSGFVNIDDVIGEHPFVIQGNNGYIEGKLKYSYDRPKRWLSEKDLWAHGYWFWDWAEERQKVESIDTTNQILTLSKPYHTYGYRRGQWYYIYNALSELDVPGEWYLDRETGIIYFWPPAATSDDKAVVSLSESLIRFTGVSYVSFEDVTMEATRGIAVSVKESNHVNLSSLVIRNTGGWGVKIEGGKYCQVLNSSIYQTGEGGISISGGDRARLDPAHHNVENNSIYAFARWQRIRPGIEVSGVGSHVAHNHIFDAPHQAIYFAGNNHVIEYNELNDVCKETNDAGAIYAGRDWTMRGNLVQYNYLHDIRGRIRAGAIGLYLDDMFSGATVIANIFNNVATAVVIGGGRDNLVADNVFVKCDICIHIDSRGLDWAAPAVNTVMMERLMMMPYRTELWRRSYPPLYEILNEKPGAAKGNKVMNNLSWQGRFTDIDDSTKSETIFLLNNINVDPEFIDMNHISAGVRKSSPLYKSGLWPLKETIGPLTNK